MNSSRSEPVGRTRWVIAEGYIPGWSHGPAPEMVSHEAVCFLNNSNQDTHIEMTIYYSDREPVRPYKLTLPARRTRHFRINDLIDPEPVPHETNFARLIESDVPAMVQPTRLDSRQSENALLSTIENSE